MSYLAPPKTITWIRMLVISSVCLLFTLSVAAEDNKLDLDLNPSANTSSLHIIHTATRKGYFAKQERYFVELIHLALQHSDENYTVQPVFLPPHVDSRSVNYLKNGTYSIHWMNTSKRLEKELLPIRVPLYKGLIGWRVLLIQQKRQQEFAKISSIEKLKKLAAIQGEDWPDAKILMKNGFSVIKSQSYDTLFLMLSRGRADFFPRSVAEIWSEISEHTSLGLAVEESILLHYPSAFYFFVAKENTRLKLAIERGLNRSIRNGEFDELFYRYHKPHILKTAFSKRRIFPLENSGLPPETPTERKNLWFSPEDL